METTPSPVLRLLGRQAHLGHQLALHVLAAQPQPITYTYHLSDLALRMRA